MTEQTPGKTEDSAVALQYLFTSIFRKYIGLNEQFASQFSSSFLFGLRSECPGQNLYIMSPAKAERDAAIRKEFNGTNREAVCRKYGISRTRLYEIVGAGSK